MCLLISLKGKAYILVLEYLLHENMTPPKFDLINMCLQIIMS